MGLFSEDSHDLDIGEHLLSLIAKRFNSLSGYAYSVSITANRRSLENCCFAFRRITELGFPQDSGPFKRLGAFAILCQEFFPFDVTIESRPDEFDAEVIWAPRVAVWSLPIFAESLSINADRSFLHSFTLPTPHFQVEFISYLRNMVHGRNVTGLLPSDHVLLERTTATGLILEAAAYVPADLHERLKGLMTHASACLDAISQDNVLSDDCRFNDPDFLNLAIGMNLED